MGLSAACPREALNCMPSGNTRSSADADNRLDAFISGQSSPCHKWRHTYL